MVVVVYVCVCVSQLWLCSAQLLATKHKRPSHRNRRGLLPTPPSATMTWAASTTRPPSTTPPTSCPSPRSTSTPPSTSIPDTTQRNKALRSASAIAEYPKVGGSSSPKPFHSVCVLLFGGGLLLFFYCCWFKQNLFIHRNHKFNK